MSVATVPARRSLRLGRLQTLAVLFGLLGVVLVAYVAPNVESTNKAFTFEPPPDPPRLSFDPRTLIVAIGVFFVITAVVSFVANRAERWEPYLRGCLMVSALLIAPLVVILSLAWSEAVDTNIVQLIVESLRLGTPIALGAMAGLWCERSGVVNIGIEGMMLAAAGVGFTAYAVLGDAQGTGWLWLSIGVAVITGGLIGALHALVSVSFRVDQIISGVVINLLALGLTSFLRSQVIVPRGISTGESTSVIELPLLSDIPVIGEQLLTGKPIFFLMFVIVAATWFVLFKTPWGLRVRSCGENPHAAETRGISTGTSTSEISVPLLSDIPVIGEQLFQNKPIFFLMFVIVAASWFVLFKTPWGLRVRSCGENPHAAETLGIDVIRIRYQAVILGGLIAGLGGAWFSMESQGGFQDNMTNGAGFIALAALIFGGWRPWSAFAGAMLFGFTRALGTRLQILDVTIGDFSIPSEFWQALPYVVTIIVVAGAVGRAIPPAADGQPYERPR